MLHKLKILKWSARKLKIPFFDKGLILDIGSGGNPHPFADVLLEKYLDNEHRYSSLKIDRPIVLGDANRMPFKDKIFSYSMAYHVLEHITTPDLFLNELQRISDSGYIETPNALYELLHPFNVHCLEVIHLDEKIVIKKKESARGSNHFITNTEPLKHSKSWKKNFYDNPRVFHNCHYWNGDIQFEIVNDDADLTWFTGQSVVDDVADHVPQDKISKTIRQKSVKLFRALRKREFSLDSILACPDCKSSLENTGEFYKCTNTGCSLVFSATPIPNFNTSV